MLNVEITSYAANTKLEHLHREAQTQRLINRAWRKRYAAWLNALAARLDFDAPSLEGGQSVKA